MNRALARVGDGTSRRYNTHQGMRDGEQTYQPSGAWPNLLELERIALDPVTSGFSGVILELSERDGLFTLLEISAATGNQVLRFTSSHEGFIRDLFQQELEGYETR